MEISMYANDFAAFELRNQTIGILCLCGPRSGPYLGFFVQPMTKPDNWLSTVVRALIQIIPGHRRIFLILSKQ